MSRSQFVKSGGQVLAVTPGVLVPLSSTPLWVKSVQVTANPQNTDFVYIGGSVGQGNPLEPRRTCEITGDNMDNGTSGKINLADIFFSANVTGEGISFIYLEGL